VAVLRALGKSLEAREWILKGVENVNRFLNGGWKEGALTAFQDQLSRSYLSTNEIQKAIEHLEYSVQVRESSISALKRNRAPQQNIRWAQDSLISASQSLGQAYRRAKMFDEAIQANEKSLSIIEANKLQTFRAGSAYENLGRLYLEKKKDSTRAEKYFVKAHVSASKLQLSSLLVSSAIQLGNLLLQKDKPSEAIEYYKKAIGNIESSRSQIQSEELRSSYFENQGNAYVGIIRASLSASKPGDAFDYNERARSRTFLDVIGTKVQLSRVSALAEEERSLRDRIRVLNARLTRQEGGEEQEPIDRTQLRRDLTAAEKAYNAFVADVKKENKEQASLMSVEPLTLKEVQERLDPGVTMLEYFVSGNDVWLWVVEKDQVEFVSASIARKDLVSKVTELRDTIYQLSEKERFITLSQELHKLLIQPALQHIRGKELIIVPHDVLHYLPFQALQSPDGRYLIEKYPMYYLSSASLLQFTQEKRRAMGEKVLAFGNPDLGDPEKNLEYADLEAQEIKSAYPQSAVYLKRDATEEKAKALSPSNDIIHFATHAELKEDDPFSSAILLAKSDKEDGRLEAREIFGMNLKASLVVLSGCDTGLGKLSTGDELVGLTRAFIYAGTPSVVASLWKIDDSSTAQLMSAFYKNLKTMTKVEALREAQLQLIRGETRSELLAKRGVGGVGRLGEVPQTKSDTATLTSTTVASSSPASISTSHPYFWAPFILVGDGK